MNKVDIENRIAELNEKRIQCQNLFQRIQSDILILTGAIEENTNHLNIIIAAENAAKQLTEKEAAKKSKAKKSKKSPGEECGSVTTDDLIQESLEESTEPCETVNAANENQQAA